MPQPSVSLLFTQAMLLAAEQLGLSTPPSAQAWLEQNPDARRLPLSVQDQIWEEFCTQSADPLLGLRLGLQTQPGHLDLVGLLLMSADTLGEALDMLLDYQPIVSEGGEFSLHQDGASVELRYRADFPQRPRERVEAVFATLAHLGRSLSGGQLQPSYIAFQHGAVAATGDYEALLACPVRFNAAHNALGLSHAALALPLIQSNPMEIQHLRSLADSTLAGLKQQSLLAQVQQAIRQEPRLGRDDIAERFHMSGRHLNRLLNEEGSSFKLLQDITRRQLAEHWLADRRLRMSEIAERLGFSDESAFAKAFRRWMGQSPAQFREQI